MASATVWARLGIGSLGLYEGNDVLLVHSFFNHRLAVVLESRWHHATVPIQRTRDDSGYLETEIGCDVAKHFRSRNIKASHSRGTDDNDRRASGAKHSLHFCDGSSHFDEVLPEYPRLLCIERTQFADQCLVPLRQ